MKKIYSKSVFEFNPTTERYEVNQDESEWHYVDDNTPIAYCGGGGLFGGGGDSGGGGGTTTTVQKSDPWSGQQPYLTTGFTQAQKLLDAPAPAYYPGNTVVPFSPETNAALAMQTNRALNGSPVDTSANQQLSSTMNGGYFNNIANNYNSAPGQSVSNSTLANIAAGNNLYGGAGFNAAYQAAANQIIPQVNSQFENSGRLNSGLAQTAQTQALGDAFASQYQQQEQNQLAANQMIGTNTQNYWNTLGSERENQIRGVYAAPSIANQDYSDISALGAVGAQKEDLQQQSLANDINKWNYNQNSRISQVQNYLNMIQGNFGGTTTTDSPFFQNRSAGALGGAMGGASLGSMLFPAAAGATPFGAIGGGALGLLSGFL